MGGRGWRHQGAHLRTKYWLRHPYLAPSHMCLCAAGAVYCCDPSSLLRVLRGGFDAHTCLSNCRPLRWWMLGAALAAAAGTLRASTAAKPAALR